MDPYREAHLFVAAIRILEHRRQSPPTIEEVGTMLDVSVEAGLATCRRLEKHGIVTIMEDPFSTKIGVADHLRIEDLPRRQRGEDNLSKDLEQFMAKKKKHDKQVRDIQAEIDDKKKKLQQDFETRLKQELTKKRGGV